MVLIKVITKLKTLGVQTTVKLIKDEIKRPFVSFVHDLRWKKFSRSRELGVSSQSYGSELIVSLTTYPARIKGIHYVIESLLMQSMKPNRVILWLADEQFPNREKDLPASLIALKEKGLTIDWCEDLRSYKKLIPTLRKFPDAWIITADDDIYYNKNMVKVLVGAYKKNPNCIPCHRGTKFVRINDEWKAIPGGYDVYDHPSFLHKLTGGAGSLYAPGMLYKDITNSELFMKLAPTNDDIWFWFMGVLNGTRCDILKNGFPALYFIKGSQDTSLCSVNDAGEELFWKQFKVLLEFYPEIEKKLINEWEKEKNGSGKIE